MRQNGKVVRRKKRSLAAFTTLIWLTIPLSFPHTAISDSHTASSGFTDLDETSSPSSRASTPALRLLDDEIAQTQSNLDRIAERINEIANDVERLSQTVGELRADSLILTSLAAEFQQSVRACARKQAEIYDLEAIDDIPKSALRAQAKELLICRSEQTRTMNRLADIRLSTFESRTTIDETERELGYLRPILRSVGEEQQTMNSKLQRLNGIRFNYNSDLESPD